MPTKKFQPEEYTFPHSTKPTKEFRQVFHSLQKTPTDANLLITTKQTTKKMKSSKASGPDDIFPVM